MVFEEFRSSPLDSIRTFPHDESSSSRESHLRSSAFICGSIGLPKMKMNEPLVIPAAKPRAKPRPRTGPVTVYLRDLAVQAAIGVAAWERKAPRTLMFDIDIERGACKAGGTDRVADTVDYAAVAASVRARLGGETYRLLERAVEDVADLLFDEFGADAVTVRAAKTGVVPETGSVGVRIERQRPPR